MKITVKKLQGGQCDVEVFPNTLVSEIKRQITRELGIPIDEQKLLLLGRTLADEQTVESYPSIKDGTKLNLVIKKPDDGLYEAGFKHYKSTGMSETDARNSANRLVKAIDDKIMKMSWDDINELCYSILLEEGREAPPPPVETVYDCDDSISL